MFLLNQFAKRYFGNENPLGKTLQISGCGGSLKVTGVIKDVPANSHFHFDLLILFHDNLGNIDDNWGLYNYYTYTLKLKPGIRISLRSQKRYRKLYKRNTTDENYSIFYVQPLSGHTFNLAS